MSSRRDARKVFGRDLDVVLTRVEEIAREVAAPRAAEVDREGLWPRHSLAALQEARLGGLVVPRGAGGLGHGLVGLARVCETLGKACGSTAICFGMHCVGSAVIAAKATPDQESQYLAPIVEGRHITSLALSEPGTGAHFYLPRTRLTAISPDSYRVDGVKSFVTNGGKADSYVISTVGEAGERDPGSFSCVVVRADQPGMTWGSPWDGVGMRGNSAISLDLFDVAVPRRDLLGQEGDEIWYVFQVIAPYFLVATAGAYLGIASAALEEATEHLRRRRYAHTGETLGEQPIVQHRLGTLWGQIERTRQLVYHAAAEGDAGTAESLPALFAAKAEVADSAVSVANEAMTLVGGQAYRDRASLERHLRDARAAHVMAPTTDVLRIWLGRSLLGLPILGD